MSDDTAAEIKPEPQPEPEPTEPGVGAGMPEAEPPAEAAAEASAASSASSAPTAAEAWEQVVRKLSELSDAIAVWAKAAADTPENRKHVDDVRAGINDVARQANEAFASVSGSDFGRQFAQGADQMGTAIGETATEFGAAAAPHVASAFAGLADVFGRAAQKVGESVSPPRSPDPGARPAPEPPTTTATPMPPSEPDAAAPAATDEDAPE
ncbi:MAG: hypothetical protein P4L93_09985 [Coriobacteriia bacterium]|nr:hypothetical protein [Coriobacteriia bacterium]